MTIPWNRNKSGDGYGTYYTAQGSTPQQRHTNFKAVKPPLKDWVYNVPADGNNGPFLGDEGAKELGPIASHRPWMPFAARNDATPGALPLPLTVESTTEGFKFSTPPVFNMAGHEYWPTRPEKTEQMAAQYFGSMQNNFRVAPATLSTDGKYCNPATFPLPDVKKTPETPYTRLEGFSDWAATASLTNPSGQSLGVTFATGSPLAFITFGAKTEYGCLLLSNLPSEPLRSWYPEGYRCVTPAGVFIQVSGANSYSQDKELTLSVEITAGGNNAKANYTVQKGETKEHIAKGLRDAFASAYFAGSWFEIGEVKAAEVPKGDFEFFVSPRDRGIVLADKDVKVGPRGGEQIVLVPKLQPAAVPADPPAGQSVIGLTITSACQRSETGPLGTFNASYALIAPTGGRWYFDQKSHLICDLTKATTKTVIVCAMPTLDDNDYQRYDGLDDAAAPRQLRRFWKMMEPYAYGCPRHLTNGKDDGTGTRFGPNEANRFTPQVKTAQGKTTVTTEFWYHLTYPAGRPTGAGGTLFCLFPHQWRGYANNTANILNTSFWGPTYWTSKGPMKLAGGGAGAKDKDESVLAFTTTYVFPGILAHLPNVAKLDKDKVSFNVYAYTSTTPHQVTTQTLKSQMSQDAATPFWAADQSKTGTPRDYIPIAPNRQFRNSADSYGWGKLMGLVGDLIPSAKDLDHTVAMNAAIRQLNAQLAQWLSGGLVDATKDTPWPPGVERWQKGERQLQAFAGDQGLFSNQQFLFYDEQWKTLIPYPTGYFADTQINDHHFHYGYWIRAAAQLALAQARKLDPDNAAGTFIKNYGATMNLIIKDIANPLRGDRQPIGANASSFPSGPAMPFMRHFDGYSGHSWASGLEINLINQELLSEAMSAWTGVIMWGEVTADTKMRDLGIWMYTHEMMSYYEYWTDCAEAIPVNTQSTFFPAGSPATVNDEAYNVAIKGGTSGSSGPRFFSQVFNGYRQLTTFFGWEPIYQTGINWLPFHGGSLYLNSSDQQIQGKLGSTWKWSYRNSKFLWDNYLAKKPLVSLKQGIDAFVAQLNASVNDKPPDKRITQSLRDQFQKIGYKLKVAEDETAQNKVIVSKLSESKWTVADQGEKTYTVERKTDSLDFTGTVGTYRATLFANTWEQIAWQGLALIDPNNDQVFEDKLTIRSSQDVWAELEKAVGSAGDEKIYGKGWQPLDGQAVSYSYYWIANVCGLGVRDATASADYPFAVKFLGPWWVVEHKPRRHTWVVWNMTDKPKTVTFSDGYKMTDVPAYSSLVKSEMR